MYGEGLEVLVGEAITQVDLLDNGERAVFTTPKGKHTFRVEGDCCSHSWIEHLTIPQPFHGGVVVDVVPGPEVAPLGPDEHLEYISVYTHAIKFSVGEIIFEYRNSSNGYYGGYIVYEGFVQD